MKHLIIASLLMAGLFSTAAAQKTDVNEGKVIYLTTAEFKQKIYDYEKNSEDWVYKGKVPAIIDFYADWCRPCKMVAPIMDELAKEYKGKVVIYKVNTDKEKELASVFQIRSIPSILYIPKTGKPSMEMGAKSKEAYKQVIESTLLK